METLFKDIRYGVRSLVKSPSFTVIAVLTLALGIGASTAIFTVVNAALLRGLPYHEPERLVHLWETTPQKSFHQREASHPDYLDWKKNQVFSGMAAYSGGGSFVLERNEGNEMVAAGRVTANFFSLLGVNPLQGRLFQDDEDRPGAAPVVVLSFGGWQRYFGGDKQVIGRTLALSGTAYTVVGVLPPNFQFAPRGSADIWVPLVPTETQLSRRFMHWVNVIARLKPGITLDQAQAGMQPIAQHIASEYADSHAGTKIVLKPLHEQFVGKVKPLLMTLFGAVGFVMLIACANIANLLLVRAAARQKELAIRAALGARRVRLLRQLLIESLLLAILGGVVGLLLAHWCVDLLIAAIPAEQLNTMPYLRGLSIDNSILLFTLTLSLLTGVVFGLAPAWLAARLDLQSVLKEGGRSTSAVARTRLRSLLVIAELALALVLLIGAGLMMKSLTRLLDVDPGFDSENLLTFSSRLPAARYDQPEKISTLYQSLLTRLESVPGVVAAGTINILPLRGGNTTRFYIANQPKPPPGQEVEANLRDISANYFSVMRVPLINGRYFTPQDDLKAPGVIIVNQTLARSVFQQQNPVGQRLIFTADPQPYEIVGVVGDEKINGLDAELTNVVYGPYLQDPTLGLNNMVVVRTKGDPSSFTNSVRNEFLALEPGLTISEVRTIKQVIANAPATFMRRYPALLIGLFAMLALVLAAVGIYGVISYLVSQQTHDIGVRMALGAQRRDVLRLVMSKGVTLALTGVGIGLVVAIAVTRLMQGLLFGVTTTDPATFATVGALLFAVALLACLVPALRATRVDPLVALRYE
ncbi:MAG TPA: ABC transporter permease [Pyrinomonadaceae bacterium]|nr:ABC transporter permease [Pyrinomonadaceae bacterium]